MVVSNRKQVVAKEPAAADAEGGFKAFLYNQSHGTVMGRTGKSWLLIIIFYIIFYAGLAVFFFLNFYIFYLTLNMEAPKYQLDSSLIGTNPGLGFRPMPDPDTNPDSTLIWFSRSHEGDFKYWVNDLRDFIQNVETSKNEADNLQNCTIENGETARRDSVCQVDVDPFGPCTSQNAFGYSLGEPCVLIKLNRIYGWTPEPYGYDDIGDHFNKERLGEDLDKEVKEKAMSRDLKSHILNETSKYEGNAAQLRMALSTVWISCEGETVADTGNVKNITYYPASQGIPGYYFPFLNQKGYQTPFIFVQLKNLTSGVLVNVECKAFAKNVKPDRMNRLATTHFEILMDL